MNKRAIGFETHKGKVLEVLLKAPMFPHGWEMDNETCLCKAERGLVLVTTESLLEKIEEYEE